MIRAIFIPLLLFATPLTGQTICAPKEEMVRRLTLEYGAEMRGRGRNGPDKQVEFWASAQTGLWTVVVVYNGRNACIVSMGEAWSDLVSVGGPDA